MKRIFFTSLVFISLLSNIFSQDKGSDVQTEIDKISDQMEEMIKMLDGPMNGNGILIDTFFLHSFEDLNGLDGGNLGLDAQNVEEALEQMMNQFQMQIQSLSEQDWDAFKELFEGFDGAFEMPENRQDDKASPKRKEKEKRRKTTDL